MEAALRIVRWVPWKGWQMIGKRFIEKKTDNQEKNMVKQQISKSVDRLRKTMDKADAVIIGAGAGLSAAAGFSYSGERFQRYFSDFEEKYNFHDMYSGGFYPYATLEEHWAYWSRYIYINRYMDAPKSVYHDLYELIKEKDYFVLTTNVDHCFQKAGFDKHRLFYTQGDYGLFQCSEPCHGETHENEENVREMVLSQGFEIGENGKLLIPAGRNLKRKVAAALVPKCPRCGKPMSMNLRADDTFVQDEGWYRAAERYRLFESRHGNLRTLYLEIGVGFNTPGIIKYNFWRRVYENPNAEYVCLNMDSANVPAEIAERSLCIWEDSAEVLRNLTRTQ